MIIYLGIAFLTLGLASLVGAVFFPRQFRHGLGWFMGSIRTLHRRTRGTNSWRRWAVRLIIITVGVLVLLLGIPLIPLPGPGWLTVVVGLGLLSLEFEWARDILLGLRDLLGSWFHRLFRSGWTPPGLSYDIKRLIPEDHPSSNSSR